MQYNLEIEKAVENINSAGAAKVLIQLPDGLKPKAKEIKEAIESQTNAEVFIWLGSCFGACDIPYYTERIGINMIIQWGHSEWKEDESIGINTQPYEEDKPASGSQYDPSQYQPLF